MGRTVARFFVSVCYKCCYHCNFPTFRIDLASLPMTERYSMV